jgi:hypothetical protein
MTILKLGSRHKSTVCDTQIMVIRTAAEPVDLRCGGVPMIEVNMVAPEGTALQPDFAHGTLIGKRYVDAADRIELLCTKGGKGSLSLGAERLQVKQPKALPSSD